MGSLIDDMGAPWTGMRDSDPRLADMLDSAEAFAESIFEHDALGMMLSPRRIAENLVMGWVLGFAMCARFAERQPADFEDLARVLWASEFGETMTKTLLDPQAAGSFMYGLRRDVTREQAKAHDAHMAAGCPCGRRPECVPHGWTGPLDAGGKPLTPRLCADHEHELADVPVKNGAHTGP